MAFKNARSISPSSTRRHPPQLKLALFRSVETLRSCRLGKPKSKPRRRGRERVGNVINPTSQRRLSPERFSILLAPPFGPLLWVDCSNYLDTELLNGVALYKSLEILTFFFFFLFPVSFLFSL